MSTYPGMTLKGEVRESVSLDEDDLSDVEDEVFIRDGKHGYKVSWEWEVIFPKNFEICKIKKWFDEVVSLGFNLIFCA